MFVLCTADKNFVSETTRQGPHRTGRRGRSDPGVGPRVPREAGEGQNVNPPAGPSGTSGLGSPEGDRAPTPPYPTGVTRGFVKVLPRSGRATHLWRPPPQPTCREFKIFTRGLLLSSPTNSFYSLLSLLFSCLTTVSLDRLAGRRRVSERPACSPTHDPTVAQVTPVCAPTHSKTSLDFSGVRWVSTYRVRLKSDTLSNSCG